MDCILTVNVGSATLKFALFQANKGLAKICSGDIKDHLLRPKKLLAWIRSNHPNVNIKIIGHRVVHGGKDFTRPTLITKTILKRLKKLIPLAPLHMPQEIGFIEKMLQDLPKIPQVACFDTSFHRTQPRLATLFAIPRKYIEKDGIIRYGFHGLSYEYIAHELSKLAKKTREGRVVIAHLGNGASLCAMRNGKSVATSMGFTALDGLMMGSRCGNIDPGIIIYLMEEKGLSAKEVEKMLYKESGLLGISGISNDIKKLLASKDPKAKEAIDLFCYRAVREIGALIAVLGGIDSLVFTGGIGEHAAAVRKKICKQLAWLGLTIDCHKNKHNTLTITTPKSKIKAYVIPTNEELMIAKHAFKLLFLL